jgi:hypothetical protein
VWDVGRLIDAHFEQRLYINSRRKELESRAHQFRVVEKRLLIRFKDTTPAPLQHLDTLLEVRLSLQVHHCPLYHID